MRNSSMHRATLALLAAALLFEPGPTRAGERWRLELVAPGRAGSSEQAQPTMDAFAAALAAARGPGTTPVVAHYTNELDAGLERLRAPDVGLAFVPFEFYLAYRDELGLAPLLAVDDEHGVAQPWRIVAGTGRVDGSAALAGGTLAGLPGYAPAAVRRVLLDGWGALPADVEIRTSRRLLGDLRAAAADGSVAVLLDPAQHAALGRLPFADSLEVVATGRAWPANLVCTVGDSLAGVTREAMRDALLALHEREDGRAVLTEMRLRRFVPLAEVDEALREAERLMAAERAGTR